jgi:hypothetical protein
MDPDLPRPASRDPQLALLAGAISHVLSYLRTGRARAALRAHLLLGRLDELCPPGGQAALRQLRRALARPAPPARGEGRP